MNLNRCNKCNVKIIGTPNYCPLCKNVLEIKTKTEGIFPDVPTIYEKHRKLIRNMLFLSFLVALTTVFMNRYIHSEIMWSAFVVLGIISCWVTIISAIKTKKNKIRSIFAMTIVTSLLILIWDYATGWNKWSVEFVLPCLFSIDVVASIFLSVVIKIRPSDWLFYLFLETMLGFTSLIFINVVKVNFPIPSIICLLISIISLGGIIIFASRALLNELKKRLHV